MVSDAHFIKELRISEQCTERDRRERTMQAVRKSIDEFGRVPLSILDNLKAAEEDDPKVKTSDRS